MKICLGMCVYLMYWSPNLNSIIFLNYFQYSLADFFVCSVFSVGYGKLYKLYKSDVEFPENLLYISYFFSCFFSFLLFSEGCFDLFFLEFSLILHKYIQLHFLQEYFFQIFPHTYSAVVIVS